MCFRPSGYTNPPSTKFLCLDSTITHKKMPNMVSGTKTTLPQTKGCENDKILSELVSKTASSVLHYLCKGSQNVDPHCACNYCSCGHDGYNACTILNRFKRRFSGISLDRVALKILFTVSLHIRRIV